MGTRADPAAACVVSGEGNAALALIEVAGPQAVRVVQGLAGRRILTRARLARIEDEVMIRRAKGITGEQVVEISCHGGRGATEAVMSRLQRAGVRKLSQAEWVRRAWEIGVLDRPRAEALWHLRRARTELAALVLYDQFRGALSEALASRPSSEWMETARLGIALTEPPTIAIAGPPNAGKSTLLNAFAQRHRAVVSPVAGTTRDPVEETVSWKGIPIRLVDTAGLAAPQDALEEAAMERSGRVLAKADAILWLTAPDAESEEVPAGRVIRVRNKIDLQGRGPETGEIAISALQERNLEGLMESVLQTLSLDPRYEPGRAVVFTREQQRELARSVNEYLSHPPTLDAAGSRPSV